MSKLIEKYLQTLTTEQGAVKQGLSKVGNWMARSGGKGKRLPKDHPINSKANKLKRVQKLKARQCPKRPTPELKAKCIAGYDKIIQRINASESESLFESFIHSLYMDKRGSAKEWRGANNPTGDDSNRPNLIRMCMTLEGNKQKINCLRKLRDAAAMNPFYQARLDRFVDAITGIYEPTPKQGTIPGNEFKETAVGDDL